MQVRDLQAILIALPFVRRAAHSGMQPKQSCPKDGPSAEGPRRILTCCCSLVRDNVAVAGRQPGAEERRMPATYSLVTYQFASDWRYRWATRCQRVRATANVSIITDPGECPRLQIVFGTWYIDTPL